MSGSCSPTAASDLGRRGRRRPARPSAADADSYSHGVSVIGACVEIEELAQRLEVDRPLRAGGELLRPDGRLVQDLAENPVDGGSRLGPLLFAEVREPVL